MAKPIFKITTLQKLYKSLLLNLVLFIGFQTVPCFSSHPQLEEGWRWRRNLDVYLQSGANFHGAIPVQQIHQEMVEHAKRLTHSLTPAFADVNLAVASITVVLQGDNQHLISVTDWLRENEAGGAALYFSSREGTLLNNIPPAEWVQPAGLASPQIWQHLRNILNNPPADLLPALQHLSDPPNRGLWGLPNAQPGLQGGNFPHHFQHSEQKLLQFLFSHLLGVAPHYNNSRIRNEILRIIVAHGFGEADMQNVRAVIFHLHSQKDLCVRCRLGLSLFATKVRNGLRAETNRPANQFIVTISSRSSYEDARMFAGHGRRTSHPIIVNIGALVGNGLNLGVGLGGNPALNIQQVVPNVLAPVAVNILNPLLGALPAQLPPPAVQDNPIITTFYTIFPDEPSLQEWNQRLPS